MVILENKHIKIEEVVPKLRELYITQSHTFLKQHSNGNYITITKEKKLILFDSMLKSHIKGNYTIGTFGSSEMTKFICFDVDYQDLQYAKWITYKIINVLDSFGLSEYHVSTSGKKGYHIEMFFSDLINIKLAMKFFQIVLNEANINKDINGNVEYRPSTNQGVKLPLGIHQISKNFCSFCDINNSLKFYSKNESYDYLMNIKKISHKRIEEVITIYEDRVQENNKSSNQTHISNNRFSKPMLAVTDKNEDIEDIYEMGMRYINEGLKMTGTRHNALLSMGLVYKSLNYTEEDTKSILIEWMKEQPKTTYTTPLQEALKDAIRIVEDIYAKDYIIVPSKSVTIQIPKSLLKKFYNELNNESERKVLFSFIVHKQKYANSKGVFFVSSNQIETMTGLSRATVGRSIKNLEKLNIIQVIEANRKQEGTYIKKPNVYSVTFEIPEKEIVLERVLTKDYEEVKSFYYDCVKHFFTREELKQILPRRQFESLVNKIEEHTQSQF